MPYKDKERQREYQKLWARRKYTKLKLAGIQRDRRVWLNNQKTPCVFCEEKEVACIDFHHIDPKSKKFALAKAVSSYGRKALEKEIRKCICICANCHRKLHAGLLSIPSNYKTGKKR